ncbi:MAG: ATP-binding cassette domain-containing protein [Thiotrichaceae bacterium]
MTKTNTITNTTLDLSTEAPTPLITTTHLSKKIPIKTGNDLIILDDISLLISAGSSVAITGTSGSGKTTLLSILAGLDLPSSGHVDLFGEDLTAMDEDQRAHLRLGNVGFVYQSFHLMSHLTALENVMLPLELDSRIHHPQERAIQALQQVGLGERLSHLPNQLSGGEQQRVALARAFVSKPKVLFADEPTGNLDQQTGKEIIELLFTMQQEYQTTLVLVTHDNQLAAQCGQHYHLQSGKLELQKLHNTN